MNITAYDKELLEIFRDSIAVNKIKVEQNVNSFITEMEENFDFGYNGINWNSNNVIIYENVYNEREEKKNENIYYFFENLKNNYHNLTDAKIIVIGDNLTNLGYVMRFDFFCNNSIPFLELPQDTYIYFLELKKIINYTFEDEIFFG